MKPHLLVKESQLLAKVHIPIATISATTKTHQDNPVISEPVIFSRAHYSMAHAVFLTATLAKKTAWFTDPTNFVTAANWSKVLFTEHMGNLIARHPLLKDIKDLIDTQARNKLPLTKAIQEPLLLLFKNVTRPIISLHYEAGNILLQDNHTVLQVITDPHIRPQYLTHVTNPRLFYAVFDENTKAQLIEQAYTLHHYSLSPKRVFVTGAPVDPRLVKKDRNRTIRAFKKRPLRLAITTGGLGTNKPEIKELLPHLAPLIKNNHLHLLLYTATHSDFLDMYRSFATSHKIPFSLNQTPTSTHPLTILHADNIVDINNLLINHAFPWADGFITKPSGDMAYEAVAAGCFLLTLNPWGEWEENIRQHFEELGVSRRLDHDHPADQIRALTTLPVSQSQPWAQLALTKARHLQTTLIKGPTNIISAHHHLTRSLSHHSPSSPLHISIPHPHS